MGVVHQVGVVNILSSELMMFGWGIPLKIKYHNLYEICCDLECIVGEVRENGEWIVQFRRGFTDDLFQQWDSLVEELEMVQLSIEGVWSSGRWKRVGVTEPSRCTGKLVYGLFG
jgi:hypothetical protein